MSVNDDKRIQSIDSIETYAYGMSKDLVCKTEEIKCNNKIKQFKGINVDCVTKEKMKENNPNWPRIPDCQFRILIIGKFWIRRNKCIN